MRLQTLTLSVMRGLSWASFSKYTFDALSSNEFFDRQWTGLATCNENRVRAPPRPGCLHRRLLPRQGLQALTRCRAQSCSSAARCRCVPCQTWGCRTARRGCPSCTTLTSTCRRAPAAGAPACSSCHARALRRARARVVQVAQGALALFGFYLVLHIVSFSALIVVSRQKQH